MGEDVHPQVVHDALPDIPHQVRLQPPGREPDPEGRQVGPRDQGQAPEPRLRRPPGRPRHDVPVDRDPVEGGAHEIGERGEEQQEDGERRDAAVGAQVP